ncbi:hypothetical protein H0G86_006789 [Trichoderma simmonsii]|uniref:Uncharacterized protein n=1 Tax=Trichoderma simmonsii TaxID=1491479 RepID=A0A8G0LF47_9HYPO|nr:hypothetical protein H0G86_006789 [Trichoderma simmonsii]
MQRCKSEALRIRQRKGLRYRKKGHNSCQHDCCRSGPRQKKRIVKEKTAGYESETEDLAKRYDNEVLGIETKESSDSDFSPNVPEYDITKMDQASKEAREAEWNIKCQKSKDYVQRYIHGTLVSPERRHSSDPSIDSSEIRREIEERAHRIVINYETLHEILLRHQPTIQARWTKKRPSQKQKVLHELWANMPEKHRPEFYAFRCAGAQKRNKKYRDWYMWPYINEQDLTARDSLLLLINSRAFHTPSNFVDGDLAAMKFGLEMGILKSVPLPGYRMTLLDSENIEDYGRLADISDYSETEILCLDEKRISPYYGILILEAQDRLMEFLVNCCKKILHDIPEDTLISDKFPIIADTPKLLNNSDLYDPAIMAAEAPYKVPARPNFKQIGLLLGAKVAELKDRVSNLREDPICFAIAMQVMKDHSPKDVEGHKGSYFRPCAGHDFTNGLQFLISKLYADFEFFADLYQQVQQLETLHAKYDADVLPFKDVPEEILSALYKYQMRLWETVNIRRSALRAVVQNSPEWFRHFTDGRPSLSSFRSDLVNYKSSSVRRHLVWLLQCVTEFDPKLPSLANAVHLILPLIMDEIETLRNNEPEAWELTSSLTGEIIDELAILAQCMEQVDMYLRRTRSYKRCDEEKENRCIHQLTTDMDHIYSLLQLEGHLYDDIVGLADTATRKLVYPWDKRRTKDNVQAMQKAERDLDKFWDAADSGMFAAIENFRESLLGQYITSVQENLRRTPDWIEEEQSIIPRAVRQRNASQEETEIYRPPFAPCNDQSDSLKKLKQDGRQCVQVKVKTKGQAHKDVMPTDANPSKEVIPEITLVMPVDTRALKVFRVLFYNPDVTSSPGEVPWNDFIHAMVSTGFSAQKLQGSIWQFNRANDDGQQTILFHEPHPHKKLPFYVARSMGWRLNRHFQWSLKNFELKKKQVEGLQ